MAETFNITLNMDKTKRQPAAIAARVGDVDSIIVNATILNGSSAYTPSGSSAYFECVCPNGYSVRQQAQLTSNVVSVTLAPEVFQVSGVINDAYFRFENGSSSDPSYVESTESFVILVYSSIDDNVEAGDYIAEWRQSQTVIEEVADEAASALPTIQNAVNSVESAATSAKSDIDAAKAEVEAAAGDVMAPINNAIDEMNDTMTAAINSFKSDGQDEIGAFDTNASNKIQQFETNASSKLSEYDTNVNEFISTAQSSVETNISELDTATQKAIDAMESALSEDQYGDLIQRISRDWKLTLQDMVVPSGTVDLNLLSVGTFAIPPRGITLSNAPVSGGIPFILFSGQYFETMKYQLALYPSGETQIYIRYQSGTGSAPDIAWGAWSAWSPISGGGSSIETPVSIANGGTGATTAEEARTNLGAGTSDFSGDYNDLSNKPAIPSVPISIQNGGTGATTAEQARQNIGAGTSNFSGSYNDLTNKPTIPDPIEMPISIANGGTGATTAAGARANIGAGTSNFSGSYNDLTDKPTIPTVPSLPLSVANGGTGARTAAQARANLGITGGGSGGLSIKLYDKADLNFVFPNVSQYTLIQYKNRTIPFSGYVQNGTYEFTGSCVIFSMMLTRKMITNPGYPYLHLTSQTMDNSTATATFDSNHGFNLFGNMSSGSISSLHPFPYIGSAGRDFWNCGYIIGRIHTSAPTGSGVTLSSGTPYIVPFSLRFDTDGWCKMLLNCQANQYLNDYLTIDSVFVPPLNIGVGGSVLS